MGAFLHTLLQFCKKWTLTIGYFTTKKMLACFQKIYIIFQILAKNSLFFLKTPQVRVAANHTYESLQTKVGGVLKTFWIDLSIPINFIICNLFFHREIWPQSYVKFHFFSFWEEKKGTVFVWKIQLFFVKVVFFP